MTYTFIDYTFSIISVLSVLIAVIYFVKNKLSSFERNTYFKLRETLAPYDLYIKLFHLYHNQCYECNKVFHTSEEQAILLKYVDRIKLTKEEFDHVKKDERLVGVFLCPLIQKHFSNEEAKFLLEDLYYEAFSQELSERSHIYPWFALHDNLQPKFYPRSSLIIDRFAYWENLAKYYETNFKSDL